MASYLSSEITYFQHASRSENTITLSKNPSKSNVLSSIHPEPNPELATSSSVLKFSEKIHSKPLKPSKSKRSMRKGNKTTRRIKKKRTKRNSRRHSCWTTAEVNMATFLHFRLTNKWKLYEKYYDDIVRRPTQIKCKIFNLKTKKQFEAVTQKSIELVRESGLNPTDCDISEALHSLAMIESPLGRIPEMHLLSDHDDEECDMEQTLDHEEGMCETPLPRPSYSASDRSQSSNPILFPKIESSSIFRSRGDISPVQEKSIIREKKRVSHFSPSIQHSDRDQCPPLLSFPQKRAACEPYLHSSSHHGHPPAPYPRSSRYDMAPCFPSYSPHIYTHYDGVGQGSDLFGPSQPSYYDNLHPLQGTMHHPSTFHSHHSHLDVPFPSSSSSSRSISSFSTSSYPSLSLDFSCDGLLDSSNPRLSLERIYPVEPSGFFISPNSSSISPESVFCSDLVPG
ncbi:hypothetical protein ADUPG1_008487, partial [Aduncisulcus paluster]